MLRDNQEYRELLKLFEVISRTHSVWDVFSDFLLMSATSISNSVDYAHRKEREDQYMATVKRYSKEEVNLFPEMLAKLVMVMEKCVQKGDMQDVMGPIFHELNLHSKYKGQFFTPQNISDMMAKMLVSEKDMDVERRGFTTICEPACGSGVMVISFAKAMQEAGYNYCRQMVVECTDIDLKCVHMAYIQLSLYGIPAVVIHGNSLAMEEWSRWYTPVYILERWTEKMNRRQDYEQDQTGH